MAVSDFFINNVLGIAVAVLVGFLAFKWLLRKKNYPPGPKGTFLFGVMNEIGSMFESMSFFRRAAKEYGEVVMCYIGRKRMIVLNNYDTIKEAFVTRSEEFSSRQLTGMAFINFNDALFCSPYNAKWKETKKYAVQALKNTGFGTPKSEEKMTSEIGELMKFLENEDEQPFDPKVPLHNMASNALISILLSKRYPWSSSELKRLTTITEEFLDSLSSAEQLSTINQWIPRFLMKLFWPSAINDCLAKSKHLREFIKEQLKEHRETLDPNNVRDFLDIYLKDGKDKEMTEDIFVNTVSIFFPDGCGTTADAINWAVLYLAYNPEEQEKAQAQINEICGSRQPTLTDRRSLTYIEAIIVESFRMGTPVSMTVEHNVLKMTEFKGYNIPVKNTSIFGNLYTCHRDPGTFPEPDKFKPSRFIGDDGKLVLTERVIPFGIGPRMCVGSQYVRAIFFLTISHLLQRFTFRFPVDQNNPTLEPDNFLITRPQSYKIVAIKRK